MTVRYRLPAGQPGQTVEVLQQGVSEPRHVRTGTIPGERRVKPCCATNSSRSCRDISQSIAFADDRHGKIGELIADGYVMKDGDLFELTAKGVTAVEEHAALGASDAEASERVLRSVDLIARESHCA